MCAQVHQVTGLQPHWLQGWLCVLVAVVTCLVIEVDIMVVMVMVLHRMCVQHHVSQCLGVVLGVPGHRPGKNLQEQGQQKARGARSGVHRISLSAPHFSCRV